MEILSYFATSSVAIFGIAALVIVGFGTYWLINKQARLREIAELRKRLDELSATDPEYGAIRALHTDMVINAERWKFFTQTMTQRRPKTFAI